MLLAAAFLLTPRQIPRFDPLELVARYRAYRLPEPPLKARPVCCEDQDQFDLPAFAAPGKPYVIYRPWEPCTLQKEDHWKIEPLATATIKDMRGDEALWPTIAVLESRAETAAADHVLKAVFIEDKFDNAEYRSPWRPLRQRAWAYWRARAIDHPSERARLLTWLRTWSKIDGFQPTNVETSYLKDLAATLNPPPPPPKPNRFDRLMAQTLTARGEALSDQKYGPNEVDRKDPLAKPVVRLWEAGFDAIPTMFRYLDDRRITRLGGGDPGETAGASPYRGIRYFRYHRLCDIAADAITTALGVGPDFYSTRPREWDGDEGEGDPDQQIADVKKMWPRWLALNKIGERQVLLKRMAGFDREQRGALDTVSTDGNRAYCLWVLAIKYRAALVTFCHHAKFAHERTQIEQVLWEVKR